MARASGVMGRRISEGPIAVIDLETTGLTPGLDRVVEVSVVRVDPGQQPRVVLETLVNPTRAMAATEIHGITDADVADAPKFPEIAGDLVGALEDCVLGAYNAYFDVRFLDFEFRHAGVKHEPPHFCLMYMRPLLGLGPRCRLAEACRLHGVELQCAHAAASDAMASSKLLQHYLQLAKRLGLDTFGDLASRGSYKFLHSLLNDPFPTPATYGLKPCGRLRSRRGPAPAPAVGVARDTLPDYWDELAAVVADLNITDDEATHMASERARLNLSPEQMRAVHAKAFASVLVQFIQDKCIDEREVRKLHRLYQCLSRLGRAPGE